MSASVSLTSSNQSFIRINCDMVFTADDLLACVILTCFLCGSLMPWLSMTPPGELAALFAWDVIRGAMCFHSSSVDQKNNASFCTQGPI